MALHCKRCLKTSPPRKHLVVCELAMWGLGNLLEHLPELALLMREMIVFDKLVIQEMSTCQHWVSTCTNLVTT